MSKYLALYSQDKYRFELYDNTRRLTRQQITDLELTILGGGTNV